MRRNIRLGSLCCGLALLLATTVHAGERPVSEITVNGEAQALMAPDMAVVSLTVARDADSARQALDANSAAMQQVLEGLKGFGIDERDLQTANFSIQPRYVYPQTRDGEPPQLVGYTVRNGLTVRVREVEKLGALLDQAVTLGVNEGGDVQFSNEDPSVAMDTARQLAVKDALAKAGTIAEAAGVKLGAILSLSEYSESPQPKLARFAADRASGMAAPPIASGENSYRVTVNLRIAIEQ